MVYSKENKRYGLGEGATLVVHSRKDKEHGLWMGVGGSFGNTKPFLEGRAGSRVNCAA